PYPSLGYEPPLASTGTQDTQQEQPTMVVTAPAKLLPVEALAIPMLPETREMIRQSSPVKKLHEALSEQRGGTIQEEPVVLEIIRPRLSQAVLEVRSLPPLRESVLIRPPEGDDDQGDETPPQVETTTRLVELVPRTPAPRSEQPAPASQTRQRSPV